MLIWIYDFESDKLPKLWSNSDTRVCRRNKQKKKRSVLFQSFRLCRLERNGKLKRERGSFLHRFPPYVCPEPLDVFSCSLFLVQSSLSEHLELTKTIHSRCQGLWLACSDSVCNSDNLACVQTLRFPFPLEGRGTPVRRLRQSSFEL